MTDSPPEAIPDFVILDTSVLFSDPWLTAPNSTSLVNNSRELNYKVVIPEVVIRELANKLRFEAQSASDDIEKVLRRVQDRLQISLALSTVDFNADNIAGRYRQYINKMLDACDGQIGDLPGDTHSKLVDKAIAAEKPFKNNDGGYSDALIWESVLSLCRQHLGTVVTFVTGNKSDFCDARGELHPHLKQETQDANPTADVRIVSSISEFVHKWVLPALKQAGTAIALFKALTLQESYHVDLLDSLKKKHGSIIRPDDFSLETEWPVFDDGGISTFFASHLVDVLDYEIQSINNMSDGSLLADATLSCIVDFATQLYANDLEEVQRNIRVRTVRRYVAPEGEAVSVHVHQNVDLEVELILEPNDGRYKLRSVSSVL